MNLEQLTKHQQQYYLQKLEENPEAERALREALEHAEDIRMLATGLCVLGYSETEVRTYIAAPWPDWRTLRGMISTERNTMA